MIQPNELRKSTCTLPPPNEMILKWAEERPNDSVLKTNYRQSVCRIYLFRSCDKALNSYHCSLQWIGITAKR